MHKCKYSVFFPNLYEFLSSVEHKISWRMLVTEELTVAIDLHAVFYILWKSMATVNCSVSNILQNIFFCAQEKMKLNNLRVSEWWHNSLLFSELFL